VHYSYIAYIVVYILLNALIHVGTIGTILTNVIRYLFITKSGENISAYTNNLYNEVLLILFFTGLQE